LRGTSWRWIRLANVRWIGIRPSGDGDRDMLRQRDVGVVGGARWFAE
jgi:hypothetical protein